MASSIKFTDDDRAAAEMFIVMFDRFFSGKKIPLYPPLTKGDVFWPRLFPLFEKEALGEIFDYGKRQRIKP